MDSPLLMPHSQVHAARKPVQLLDADGTVVCLPFQLNIPFCKLQT
jgi:translation initiation factor 2-alpha kinase 4